MNTSVLARASHRGAESRSASTATASPNATVTAGTIIIHSRVLISVCWKSWEDSSLVKLSKPTHSVLVESLKL